MVIGDSKTVGNASQVGLFWRALVGFVPSVAAVGLVRAWLSLQTGISDLYVTAFASDGGLFWVPQLTLVVGSIVVALSGRLFSSSASRCASVTASGVFGALAVAVGMLCTNRPVICGIASALGILSFLLMLRVWCGDNVTSDLSALLVRLSASFAVQYGAYAFVLVLPDSAQRVCAVVMPLLIMALLWRPPARDTAGPAAPIDVDTDGVLAKTPFSKAEMGVLVSVVVACCVAHGLLFGFSATVTGVWLIGLAVVVLAVSVQVLSGTFAITLRHFVLLAVFCQAVGVVFMLLFSYDYQWTSFSKAVSYAASMMLTQTIGCFLASRPAPRGTAGSRAFVWLALYFVAFYAANVGVRMFKPEATVVLAVILVCLIAVVAVVLLFYRDEEPAVESEEVLPFDACCRVAHMCGLTPREQEILALIASDVPFKEIARRNGVSVNTVRAQSQSLYRKLSVHTKEELKELLQTAPE